MSSLLEFLPYVTIFLLRNAESLPQMARAFLDAVYEATGFRGIVSLVGPDPLGTDNRAHSMM